MAEAASKTTDGSPEYCFVLACPRSGSSATIRLLHGHPLVVMGLERYRHRYRRAARGEPLGLGPADFEPTAFLQFEVSDTGAVEDRFPRHFELARDRMSRGLVRVVGDKVLPAHPAVVAQLVGAFESCRFVVLFRDPVSVADSYLREGRNPARPWPEGNDHLLAAQQWNDLAEAFAEARRLVPEDRIHVVSAEALFNTTGHDVMSNLFSFIGLTPTPAVDARWLRSCERWQDQANRERIIDDVERRQVLSSIDGHLLSEVTPLLHLGDGRGAARIRAR